MFAASGATAAVTSLYKDVTSPGASLCTSWNVKHSRLLPLVSEAALNTPLLRFEGSTPTKELGVPVLPPGERSRESLSPYWLISERKLRKN